MRPAAATPARALTIGLATVAAAAVLTAASSRAAPSRAAPSRAAQPPVPTTPAATTPSTLVSAKLKFIDGSEAEVPVWSQIRVSITRNGEQVTRDQPLPELAGASYFTHPKLTAIDLNADHEPEVLVDVYSAGYERLRRTVLFHLDGRRYVSSVISWGVGGYRLDDVTGAGAPQFLAADPRVARLFDSSVRGPLRVLAFNGRRLVDRSAVAASQVRRDARRQARDLRHSRRTRAADTDTRATVAAYVLDLVRLGQIEQARGLIRTAAKNGELHGSARSFARQLDDRMVAWGYVPSRVLGRLR